MFSLCIAYKMLILQIQLGPDYDDLYTDLDLSVKLFGSDIGWINYHHDRVDSDELKKKLQGKLDETLDKSKSIDVSYHKIQRMACSAHTNY